MNVLKGIITEIQSHEGISLVKVKSHDFVFSSIVLDTPDTADYLKENKISTNILLKGGHNTSALGTDLLFLKDKIVELLPSNKICFEKHGSGCVLSSAIASNLALDQTLTEACKNAKNYIENYLNSTSTLIGYHYV